MGLKRLMSVGNAGGADGAFFMSGGAVTAGTTQVGSGGYVGEDRCFGLMVMTGGTLTNRNDLIVGGEGGQNYRDGELIVAGGAEISAFDDMFVGGYSGAAQNGSRGIVTVSNGTIYVGDAVVIGKDSASTGRLSIVHADGRLANGGNLIVGQFSNDCGFVTVDAGRLSVGNNLLVGDGAETAYGEIQIHGGAVSVGDVVATGDLNLGDNAGATGIVTITGGSLTVSRYIYVGNILGDEVSGGGYGIFTANNAAITNGSNFGAAINDYTYGYVGITNCDVSLGGAFYAGNDQFATGEVYIIGGTLALGSGYDDDLNVATSGGANTGAYGRVNIDVDGANIALDGINVAQTVSADGVLLITNVNTTVVMDNAILVAGQEGATGTVRIARLLRLGGISLGADINIANAAGTYGDVQIDDVSIEHMDQIKVAQGSNSWGRLVLHGTVTNYSDTIVASGQDSVGYMEIDSYSTTGKVDLTSDFLVGTGAGSDGTVVIHGGTIMAKSAFTIGQNAGAVGLANFSNMTITNGDYVNVGWGNAVGTLNLTNVDWKMTALEGTGSDKPLRVGINAGGVGTLNLVGGTFDASGDGGNDVQIALNASSTGTVNLSGGAALVADLVQVGLGDGALGMLNIADSTVTANQLVVGNTGGGQGIAWVSGTSVIHADEIEVGYNVAAVLGTLNIEGGTVNVGTDDGGNGYFSIGNASNTTAVVNMSGGTVNLLDTSYANLRIGINGEGTFNLSGGQVNATNQQVNIGQNTGGNGVLNVSGGGVFNADGINLAIGASGNSAGAVNVYGGYLAANQVNVGNAAAGTGVFTLTNGVAVVNQVRIANGANSVGLVVQSGGSNILSGSLSLGNDVASGSAEYRALGGVLDVGGNVTVGTVGGTNTFWVNGGMVRVGGTLSIAASAGATGVVVLAGGTLDMQGGTVNFGTGEGRFQFTGGLLKDVGTFSGALTQEGGELQIGSSPGTMNVGGDYSLEAGAQLTLELAAQGTLAGTDFDLMNVSGNATLAGVILINDISGGAIDTGVPFTWDVLKAEEINLTGTVNTPAGVFYRVLSDAEGTIDALQLYTIPEPGTLGLVGLLLAGVLLRRRMRPGA